MKVSKAIEVIEKIRAGCSGELIQPYIDACNLSIEALKRVKNTRVPQRFHPSMGLPGETPEEEVNSKMKVSKAIEILGLMGTPEFDGHTEDIREARLLGIEALKRHRDRDYITYNGMHELLRGETPEEAGR